MFNKILKYKFWILGGIILVLGINFMCTMSKDTGFVHKGRDNKSLLFQAEQYYLNGEYKKACNLYEKTLVLEPDKMDAVINLAIIYDDYLSYKDRAIELYKKYIELNPKTEKKELIQQWIVDAAQESLGMQHLGSETYQNKLSKLQTEFDELSKKNINLEEEVKKLSGKLYNIQAEHQKEIASLQEQRDQLLSQITMARMKIGDLVKALRISESARAVMQKKLEEALDFQKRFKKPQTKESG